MDRCGPLDVTWRGFKSEHRMKALNLYSLKFKIIHTWIYIYIHIYIHIHRYMHLIFFQIPDITDIHKKHPPNRKTKRGRAEVGGNSAYEGKQFRCPGCPARRFWNAKDRSRGSRSFPEWFLMWVPTLRFPNMPRMFQTLLRITGLVIGTMTLLAPWVNAGLIWGFRLQP